MSQEPPEEVVAQGQALQIGGLSLIRRAEGLEVLHLRQGREEGVAIPWNEVASLHVSLRESDGVNHRWQAEIRCQDGAAPVYLMTWTDSLEHPEAIGRFRALAGRLGVPFSCDEACDEASEGQSAD